MQQDMGENVQHIYADVQHIYADESEQCTFGYRVILSWTEWGFFLEGPESQNVITVTSDSVTGMMIW